MSIVFACSFSCEWSSKPITDASASTLQNVVPVEEVVVRSCPRGMIEVSGTWCPRVEQLCLKWVDAGGNSVDAPKPGTTGRCAEFKNPSRCLTPKDQRPFKRFCVDMFEYGGSTTSRPKSWLSWYDAKTALEFEGKRLCTDSEWSMACEGPTWQPYPYGDGYHRDKTACNFDNSVKGIDVFLATSPLTETARKLNAMLVFSGTMPRCVSSYGVHDMVGNIDELVVNESGAPYVSGLKGGHIFGVRNACRPMTEVHGPTFSWYETGTRGCLSL